MRIIHDLVKPRHAQFLIATHSPILLAYPEAILYQFEDGGIREVTYRETDHYLIMKDFLNSPERMIRYLFAEDEESDTWLLTAPLPTLQPLSKVRPQEPGSDEVIEPRMPGTVY